MNQEECFAKVEEGTGITIISEGTSGSDSHPGYCVWSGSLGYVRRW